MAPSKHQNADFCGIAEAPSCRRKAIMKVMYTI